MAFMVRGEKRGVTPLLLLGAFFLFSTNGAAGLVDLDGDGKLDANDVFVFASLWMTDSPAGDLIGDGIVNDHDLLELVRQFRMRPFGPTPTPGPILAPVWTHPSVEDMMKQFYPEDGQADDFLDWSDVPGAAAYEVIADITMGADDTPILVYTKTWHVEATRTPGVPVSNSKVQHISQYTDLVKVRVRALSGDPTPLPGPLSDERIFYLTLDAADTFTPTPTIDPTPVIDFNGDEITNRLDLLYLQKSWMTRLGQQAHYDPAVAVLADPTTEVDASDVLAFAREYERQRVPIPVPVLISPASGAAIPWPDFASEGMRFDWDDPVPEVKGGVRYILKVYGPYPPVGNTRDSWIYNIYESEYTGTFATQVPQSGSNEYRWTVLVESRYGIKIPSEAPRSVFYVE